MSETDRLAREKVFIKKEVNNARVSVQNLLKTKDGLELLKEETARQKSLRIARESTMKNMTKLEKDQLNVRQLFQSFDTSGDGKIDMEEFTEMLKALCLPFKQKEVVKAFNVVDEDGSGEIEFNEFVKWYNETGKPAGKKMKVARYKMKYQRRRRDNSGQTDRQTATRVIIKATCDKCREESLKKFRSENPVIDINIVNAAELAEKNATFSGTAPLNVIIPTSEGDSIALELDQEEKDELEEQDEALEKVFAAQNQGLPDSPIKRNPHRHDKIDENGFNMTIKDSQSKLNDEMKNTNPDPNLTQVETFLAMKEPNPPALEFHYIDRHGNNQGPFNPEVFIKTAFSTLFIWFEGQTEWMQVRDIPRVSEWMKSVQWFVLTDTGVAEGPMLRLDLLELLKKGRAYIWRYGMDEWVLHGDVPY